MRIKVVFVSILALLLFSQNSFSQRPGLPSPVLQNDGENSNSIDFYKVGDITGNIGDAKAILLPKPIYPIEAKDAGAEGKVKVEITIDESGSVTAAKAVSGHPTLFEATQKAALQSKFSVPKVGGQGTQVSGVLNYNFLIEMPNWFKVGYDIAVIEKTPSLGFFQIGVIRKVVKPDWQTEFDLLAALQEIKDEERKALAAMPVEKPVVVNRTTRNSVSRMIIARLPIPPQNPRKISLSQDLITAFQQRLANDETSLWQFNLGLAFVKVQELYRNPNTRQNSAEILKPFVQNAPINVSAEYLEHLKSLIISLENQTSADVRIEIGKTIAKLQRIK